MKNCNGHGVGDINFPHLNMCRKVGNAEDRKNVNPNGKLRFGHGVVHRPECDNFNLICLGKVLLYRLFIRQIMNLVFLSMKSVCLNGDIEYGLPKCGGT
jgi:hypothetical protein